MRLEDFVIVVWIWDLQKSRVKQLSKCFGCTCVYNLAIIFDLLSLRFVTRSEYSYIIGKVIHIFIAQFIRNEAIGN